MPRILLLVTMALLSAVLLLRVVLPSSVQGGVAAPPAYDEPAEVLVLLGESEGLAVMVLQRHAAPQRRALEATVLADGPRFDVVFENHGDKAHVLDLSEARLQTREGRVLLRASSAAAASDARPAASTAQVWNTVLEGALQRPLAPGTQRRCSLSAAASVAISELTEGWVSGVALQTMRLPRAAVADLTRIELSALLRKHGAAGGGL